MKLVGHKLLLYCIVLTLDECLFIASTFAVIQWLPAAQQKQAAASFPCGSPSMKSTTSVCSICFNLPSAPGLRSVRFCECVMMALEMPMWKVWVFFSTWFRCSCGTSLMHSNCYICLQTWGGLTSWTWVKPSRYCNMETKIEVLLPRRWTSPQAEGKPWNNNYHPIFHFCNWYACFVYSHSIFTMKLLKIESDAVKSISE